MMMMNDDDDNNNNNYNGCCCVYFAEKNIDGNRSDTNLARRNILKSTSYCTRSVVVSDNIHRHRIVCITLPGYLSITGLRRNLHNVNDEETELHTEGNKEMDTRVRSLAGWISSNHAVLLTASDRAKMGSDGCRGVDRGWSNVCWDLISGQYVRRRRRNAGIRNCIRALVSVCAITKFQWPVHISRYGYKHGKEY